MGQSEDLLSYDVDELIESPLNNLDKLMEVH